VVPVEKAREVLAGSVRLTVASAGLDEDLLLRLQDSPVQSKNVQRTVSTWP
jgi:hypothetical protein